MPFEAAFTGAGTTEEKRLRCQALIERVCKNSPTGKKVLDAALKNGVKIRLTDGLGCVGAYDAEKKDLPESAIQRCRFGVHFGS